MDEHARTLIAALDAFLEDERAAVLAGDLDAVRDLHDRKTALIDALNDLDAEAAAQNLQDLREKVDRKTKPCSTALWQASGPSRGGWPQCGVFANRLNSMAKMAANRPSISASNAQWKSGPEGVYSNLRYWKGGA